VTPSVYFPLGSKTSYKKNASEWVIEFESKAPDQCISPIGRSIGMEPILVQSVWQPTIELNPDRPVEGFYLLREVPNITLESITPALFHSKHPETALESLLAVKGSIRESSLFESMGLHASKRDWWEDWFKYIPESIDPIQYREKLERLGIPYKEPLKEYLYPDSYKAPWSGTWDLGTGLELVGHGYNLPEITAVAGNCVGSDFNPNPVHPRLYSVRDETLKEELAQYQTGTAPFFLEMQTSRVIANHMFITVIRRKVSYDCHFISLGKLFAFSIELFFMVN